MSERFKAIEGSDGHDCCFDATVIDTTKPVMIAGRHYKDKLETVCECTTMEDAVMIALALNLRA